MGTIEIEKFFKLEIEDKLKKVFPLFQKYRVDSYLNRKIFDKQGYRDLCLIWITIFITLAIALLLIFAFLF